MSLNLVAVRVDDRLIHGQGMAWLKFLPINLVVVVNDAVAGSELEKELMTALVPSSCEARFFSVQKAIDTLHQAGDWQKIFLLFKDLKDLAKCLQGGIPMTNVNIGNVRKKANSIKLSPYVNLTKEELQIIANLLAKGIKLNSRQTPQNEAPGEQINFWEVIKTKL